MADIIPSRGLALLTTSAPATDTLPGRAHAIHIRLSPHQVQQLKRAARSNNPPELLFGGRQVRHEHISQILQEEPVTDIPLKFLHFNDEKVPLKVRPLDFPTDLHTVAAAEEQAEISASVSLSHRAIIEKANRETGRANAAAELLKARMRAHEEQRSAEQSVSWTPSRFSKLTHRISRTSVVNNVKAGRRGNLRTSAISSTPASSPRPSSSSLAPLSTSPRSAQLAAQKYALFHLLALGPSSESTLCKKTDISREDLLPLLEKHANKEGDNYELDKRFFRELDVWNFPYSKTDRRNAIDNAVHAFDRQRISKSDEIWDILNAPSDRGRGICRSRLHLDAEKRPPADHRKMLATTGSIGGSSPLPKSAQNSPGLNPSKKPSEREQQAKRLSSKKPSKAAPRSTEGKSSARAASRTSNTLKGATGPKTAESKKADPKNPATGQKRKAGQALSADVVVDSDEEAAQADRDMQAKKQKTSNGTPKSASETASRPTATKPKEATSTNSAAVAKDTKRNTAATAAAALKTPASKAPSSLDASNTRKKLAPTTSATATSSSSTLASKQAPANTSTPKQSPPKARRPEINPTPAKSASTSQNSSQKNSYVSTWVGSLPPASKGARRLSGGATSLASTASSMKRTSSSDGEPSAKRMKNSQGHAPFASSPLTSVASSSEGHERAEPPTRPRMPDLPPKKDVSSSNSPDTARSMTLAELKTSRTDAFCTLLKLRMEDEKLPAPDQRMKARIAERFSQYDFLTSEIASRENKRKSQILVPCDIDFPADCSVFLAREYERKLAAYLPLYEKTSDMQTPSDQDKKSLWMLHNELETIARLQKAALESEHRAKLDAKLASGNRSVTSASSVASANLSRAEAIDEYEKYHKLYNAWCSLRAQLRTDASYPELPAAKLKEDRDMFAQLSAQQVEIVGKFEGLRKAFAERPSTIVRKSGQAVSNRTETELLAWKVKSRAREWASRYEKMLAEFGEWTGREMKDLWAEQQEIRADQREVYRAFALEFGKKDEARLEDLELEQLIERISSVA